MNSFQQKPPWCGACDPTSREFRIEDTGAQAHGEFFYERCPRCHPDHVKPCPVHGLYGGVVEDGEDVEGCTCKIVRKVGFADAYAEMHRQDRAKKDKIRDSVAFHLWVSRFPEGDPQELQSMWQDWKNEDAKNGWRKKADVAITAVREAEKGYV